MDTGIGRSCIEVEVAVFFIKHLALYVDFIYLWLIFYGNGTFPKNVVAISRSYEYLKLYKESGCSYLHFLHFSFSGAIQSQSF